MVYAEEVEAETTDSVELGANHYLLERNFGVRIVGGEIFSSELEEKLKRHLPLVEKLSVPASGKLKSSFSTKVCGSFMKLRPR